MSLKQETGYCKSCDAQRLLLKGRTHNVAHGIATVATGGAWGLAWGAKKATEPPNVWRCSVCGTPTEPAGSFVSKVERLDEKLKAIQEEGKEGYADYKVRCRKAKEIIAKDPNALVKPTRSDRREELRMVEETLLAREEGPEEAARFSEQALVRLRARARAS